MTVLNTENKATETQNQEKNEISSPNQKVELNAPLKMDQIESQSLNENSKESQEDPNWKAFREARKRDRAEKEAAERRAAEKEAELAALKAAMEAAFSKNTPSPTAYQQYYGINQEEETEDQKIEKKLNQLLEAREQKYLRENAEREMREYPNRLQRDFPDFHGVVSQENLDYLDFHYPELSRPLQRLQEGYDKWHDIYHAIKKFVPNHSTAKKESMKAEINSQKPKSMSTSNHSPTGQKTMDTWQDIEQRRAANWERMQRVLKGV